MKILTPFALIVLLFFNSSCEKDLYEDAVYQPEKSIIKYGIQENQLKSEPVFNDVKNQFTSIVNSNNSKSNNTSFFDLEQDLINRLDLEKTHLNSIGNKQVLNAPIKTFGSYKRALLALKNNQHTSAYIITYPNPQNDAVFYVANLQGKLLQKVTIQPNGIGLVEYFNDTNANTSNKENQNTTYNSGCSETVYVTCSKGIHSFDLGNAHECHYWNNLSQGTPPRVFSIACDDSGGSGGNDNYDPNDNPFETGNGNPNDNPYDGSDNNNSGGGFSTVPSQNCSNPDGISNCITNIDCPDCNLQNDINNDCNLDANEIMFNAFYNNSLNNRQQLFLDINVTTKNNIFNYLKGQFWSNESQVFAKDLIDFYNDENIIGEEDLKNKIKQAIANGITSTAEFTHKIFKKFSYLAEEYPSSKSYINSVLETINDAAATVTDTNPQTCTFADLFNMWLFELGPNPININGSNTTSTNQLKTQEGVNQARNLALAQIQNGTFNNVSNQWQYGQAEFYDGMANGNFVTAFLGTYTTSVTITQNSTGYQLNFHVWNTSSWESATRFRIDNDNDGAHDGIFPNTNRDNDSDLSMGGNFTQHWYWSEPVN